MGNGNKIQIGLLNLDGTFYSGVGGSKVIKTGDIMYEGNSANINVGRQAQSTDNTKGFMGVTTGNVMYKGNGASINIGLQNLDFFPNSFFSNEGGSKVTTTGDIMT